MKWTVHGERTIYDSEWMRLALVDVELPSGARFEHHVLRMPAQAAGVVVDDPDRGVLLLWRHRFITDTWGWEVPAGKVDDGEEPLEAAAREVREETGWVAGPLEHLISFHPTNGMSDHTVHVYRAQGATHVGEPTDPSESERVEWVPVERVRALLGAGAIGDGLSVCGLSFALATGRLD